VSARSSDHFRNLELIRQSAIAPRITPTTKPIARFGQLIVISHPTKQ
jgi:hypothetical protein